MPTELVMIPYLGIAYIALVWFAGLLGLRLHIRRLDAEVQRFAQQRTMTMVGGHHLRRSTDDSEVHIDPVRVSVRRGARSAWVPATAITVQCDEAQHWFVFDRKRRFVGKLPAIGRPTETGDAEFDRRFTIRAASDGRVPLMDEPLLRQSAQQLDLLTAYAHDGKLEAKFRSDRLHDQRLGSFAHLDRALQATLALAQPRRFGLEQAILAAPPPKAPRLPVLIHAFPFGLVGGMIGLALAERVATSGWQPWHGGSLGFIAGHLPGFLLLLAARSLRSGNH